MLLTDSVKNLKGIGDERAKKLNSLSIYTIGDLLMHFPKDYLDRSEITKIADLEPGQIQTIKAYIISKGELLKSQNIIVTKVKARDETGVIDLVWYNQPYLKNYFKTNEQYILSGKVEEKYKTLQMASPEHELFNETKVLSGGRITPVYTLTKNLSQKVLRQIIYTALESTEGQDMEYLPQRLLEAYGLCGRSFAIKNIHFPESDELFFSARKRLVFDELLMAQMALFQVRGYVKKQSGVVFETGQESLLNLPFSLTQPQMKVLEEIKADVTKGVVMNRLLQGDVGSGKTVVAMIATLWAIKSGYQAAVMAPTEVLAKQHFDYFQKNLEPLGIKTVLLSGSLKKKERESAFKGIFHGDIHMVVGTHAVISEGVTFNNLALVITDEQHRFGVRQRQALASKGNDPHVLVMTATPIPRTLALILYGDLDISIIDGLPPGRIKIETYSVGSSYHQRIYEFIKKEVCAGRQAYIICSAIEETEDKDKYSVLPYTEKLKGQVFNGINVECLHGKMKPDEKNEIMSRFAANTIQILVSTTVIEVGINVPNATVMVIENADRFGLAQLHQLRGRVGRGKDKSYCIMITDAKSKITKQRLKVMCDSNDGFEISEKDLQLRGHGDFFGTRQHGLPDMRIANLYKDMPALDTAQKAAVQICDGYFSEDEAGVFYRTVKGYFKLPEDEVIL